MKLFGIISFSLLIAFTVTVFDFIFGNGYVYDFITDDLLIVLITLFGVNIAVHTILVGQLSSIEVSMKHIGYFKKTRKELKDNIIFNLALIILVFCLNSLFISDASRLASLFSFDLIKNINYGIEILMLSCCILAIFLIKETIDAVFKVYDLKIET